MNKIKKIVSVLTIFGLLGIIAPAQALTADELLVQIQSLQTQLNALMAQYQTLTGAPAAGIPAACSGVTFSVNLTVGSSGNDVKCLQALFNTDVATQVAATGVGSSGAETIYFGPLTQAGAVKFQEKYAAEILTPLGLSAGTGFVGASTRAKLNSMVSTGVPAVPGTTPTTPLSGTEGTLTVTAAASPANAQNVYVGQEKVAVAGLNIKALGSDIRVDRLDIKFTTRPWLNVSNITIADAGTDVIVYDVTSANTIEVVAGLSYTVRLIGLNIVVPDGVTKTITVKVTPKLVAGDPTEPIIYQILTNGVRGTDGAGIVQYAPSEALSARTFTITTASGALAVSVNASNPIERAVIGSATAATENVELLRLDLKATINDVIVSQIMGTLTDDSTVLQTLKLYDGDTLLAATSTAGSGTSTFTALNIRVAKDTTKTLSIKGDVRILTEALMNKLVSIVVPATADGVTAADAGTFATVTGTGSTATGKTVRAYTVAPSLALVSTEINAVTRGGQLASNTPVEAIAKIKFNVTAMGGNIYLGDAAGSGITEAADPAASTTVLSTYTSNATNDGTGWLVNQGETKWFEVTSSLTNATTVSARYIYLKITNILWGTTTTTGVDWNWDSIPLEYRTSPVLLKPWN